MNEDSYLYQKAKDLHEILQQRDKLLKLTITILMYS